MMKYQLISKRKRYYLCQLCSLVFITAKAIRAHYCTSHRGLDCNVPEDLEEADESDESDLVQTEEKPSKMNVFNLNTLKEAEYITLTNSFPSLAMPLPAVSNGNAIQLYNNPLQAAYQYQFTAQPGTSMIGVKSAPTPTTAQVQVVNVVSNPPVGHQANAQLVVHQPSTSKAQRNATTNHQNNNGTSDTGGAQIICEICKKKFSTIYNKKRHEDMFHSTMALSNLPLTNKCSMCSKVFNSIYNKKRHEATHKPLDQRLKFKCHYPGCNKEYTTISILKIHMKKVHNIELATEQ